jgi:hypothetical protein
MLAVIGIMLLAMPVSANPVCNPVLSEGSGILMGTYDADLDTGSLNLVEAIQSDFLWEQISEKIRYILPVNGATIVNLGVVDFDAITRNHLEEITTYSTTPIPGNDDSTNQLVNGDVFAVHTSSGNYAKVTVINYGYDITLRWVTYDSQCHINAPEFPSAILPGILIIGLLGTIFYIRKTRES